MKKKFLGKNKTQKFTATRNTKKVLHSKEIKNEFWIDKIKYLVENLFFV